MNQLNIFGKIQGWKTVFCCPFLPSHAIEHQNACIGFLGLLFRWASISRIGSGTSVSQSFTFWKFFFKKIWSPFLWSLSQSAMSAQYLKLFRNFFKTFSCYWSHPFLAWSCLKTVSPVSPVYPVSPVSPVSSALLAYLPVYGACFVLIIWNLFFGSLVFIFKFFSELWAPREKSTFAIFRKGSISTLHCLCQQTPWVTNTSIA